MTPCPHVSWGMAACRGCGRYERCCLACQTCGDCQDKTTPVAAEPKPVPALRVCNSCLVVRLKPGQGTCDVCRGVPSSGSVEPSEPEREPMSGITLG